MSSQMNDDADLAASPALTEIFVDALELPANIGVYAHEHGRTQPLLVSIHAWADVSVEKDALAETVNYKTFVDAAALLAADGHFDLVETYINQLADEIMRDERIQLLKLRAAKPEAIANATRAGAAIIRKR